jgi:hypothetical protein
VNRYHKTAMKGRASRSCCAGTGSNNFSHLRASRAAWGQPPSAVWSIQLQRRFAPPDSRRRMSALGSCRVPHERDARAYIQLKTDG